MKAEIRRNQILDCAKKVFADKGYHNSHVEDIIKEAKIGKGTIYEYFRNKEDIFTNVLMRSLQEWKDTVAISHDDIKNLDPFDYFKHRIIKTLSLFANDRELGNILFRTGFGFDEKISSLVGQFENNVTVHVIHDLKLARRFGFVRKDIDLSVTATILVGSLLILAYKYILSQNHITNEDLDNISNSFVQSFVVGIFDQDYNKAVNTVEQ